MNKNEKEIKYYNEKRITKTVKSTVLFSYKIYEKVDVNKNKIRRKITVYFFKSFDVEENRAKKEKSEIYFYCDVYTHVLHRNELNGSTLHEVSLTNC